MPADCQLALAWLLEFLYLGKNFYKIFNSKIKMKNLGMGVPPPPHPNSYHPSFYLKEAILFFCGKKSPAICFCHAFIALKVP